MTKMIFQGSKRHQIRSFVTLWRTVFGVLLRRAIGKPLVREWPIDFEMGTLFIRRQFNHAFSLTDINEGRAYFDSLVTMAQDVVEVDIVPSSAGEPKGDWFIPKGHSSALTMLYLHGGGYTFYLEVTKRWIALLAQKLQMPIFAVDYRLTPEHAHPAQLEDSLSAYRHLLENGVKPSKLVVCGDSAGGHLLLMTLSKLAEHDLPQPALGIGISPWTDIGQRGASQFGNDQYDMVQGYQTLKYGQWLKGNSAYSEQELSPIDQDFSHCAPIYLQAGGKEILVDMIRDFAHMQKEKGVAVRLDVWPHMTHEFHAYGDTLPQSCEAIQMLGQAIAWATSKNSADGSAFQVNSYTEVNALG